MNQPQKIPENLKNFFRFLAIIIILIFGLAYFLSSATAQETETFLRSAFIFGPFILVGLAIIGRKIIKP